jgi:hypothetical protein
MHPETIASIISWFKNLSNHTQIIACGFVVFLILMSNLTSYRFVAFFSHVICVLCTFFLCRAWNGIKAEVDDGDTGQP